MKIFHYRITNVPESGPGGPCLPESYRRVNLKSIKLNICVKMAAKYEDVSDDFLLFACTYFPQTCAIYTPVAIRFADIQMIDL